MPRLVGKRSNLGISWGLTAVLVAIAGLGVLEYKGYTSWLPELEAQRQPWAESRGDS